MGLTLQVPSSILSCILSSVTNPQAYLSCIFLTSRGQLWFGITHLDTKYLESPPPQVLEL